MALAQVWLGGGAATADTNLLDASTREKSASRRGKLGGACRAARAAVRATLEGHNAMEHMGRFSVRRRRNHLRLPSQTKPAGAAAHSAGARCSSYSGLLACSALAGCFLEAFQGGPVDQQTEKATSLPTQPWTPRTCSLQELPPCSAMTCLHQLVRSSGCTLAATQRPWAPLPPLTR